MSRDVWVSSENDVRIEPWGKGDLPLLTTLMGDPEMTRHIGGPESAERLAERQARYERPGIPGSGQMFKIILEGTGEAVGSVGYWERVWRNEPIYETGWSVLTAYQGRGIATKATSQVLILARQERRYRFIHAFPSVANPPSNAICRKLGFTLIGECQFEFPPGHFSTCNDWRLDLFADPYPSES